MERVRLREKVKDENCYTAGLHSLQANGPPAAIPFLRCKIQLLQGSCYTIANSFNLLPSAKIF